MWLLWKLRLAGLSRIRALHEEKSESLARVIATKENPNQHAPLTGDRFLVCNLSKLF